MQHGAIEGGGAGRYRPGRGARAQCGRPWHEPSPRIPLQRTRHARRPALDCSCSANSSPLLFPAAEGRALPLGSARPKPPYPDDVVRRSGSDGAWVAARPRDPGCRPLEPRLVVARCDAVAVRFARGRLRRRAAGCSRVACSTRPGAVAGLRSPRGAGGAGGDDGSGPSPGRCRRACAAGSSADDRCDACACTARRPRLDAPRQRAALQLRAKRRAGALRFGVRAPSLSGVRRPASSSLQNAARRGRCR